MGGISGGSGIYGGRGIYGDGDPHLRDYRTPPFIEQELLDPANHIWASGNIFLRLHPEYLYPCLGERIVRASDAHASPEAREQSVRELGSLRKSVRNYFKRTRRPPGRPHKLTPAERDNMAAEHTKLCKFVRERASPDSDASVPHEALNRLFRDPAFQKELFSQFPLKQACDRRIWNRFLKETSPLSCADRALRFLGLRYDVSRHSIHRAIWPPRSPSGSAQGSPAHAC